MRWQDFWARLALALWVALAAMMFTSHSARGQTEPPQQEQPPLRIAGVAHKMMTIGFDTARVENVFCVWWHEIKDTVALDSVMVPVITYADSNNVSYQQCPRMMATAHWHFVDRGAWHTRSPLDSATLVNFPAPFGILLLRRRYGDHFPVYVYYDR